MDLKGLTYSIANQLKDECHDSIEATDLAPWRLHHLDTSQNTMKIVQPALCPICGFPGNILNHNSQAGYSRFCQDYMAHGSLGLFTLAGFSDPLQGDATQSHFSVADPNALQPQVEAKKDVPRDYQNVQNRSNSSSHGSPGPTPTHTKKIFVAGLASTVLRSESDFKNYFDRIFS